MSQKMHAVTALFTHLIDVVDIPFVFSVAEVSYRRERSQAFMIFLLVTAPQL